MRVPSLRPDQIKNIVIAILGIWLFFMLVLPTPLEQLQRGWGKDGIHDISSLELRWRTFGNDQEQHAAAVYFALNTALPARFDQPLDHIESFRTLLDMFSLMDIICQRGGSIHVFNEMERRMLLLGDPELIEDLAFLMRKIHRATPGTDATKTIEHINEVLRRADENKARYCREALEYFQGEKD